MRSPIVSISLALLLMLSERGSGRTDLPPPESSFVITQEIVS